MCCTLLSLILPHGSVIIINEVNSDSPGLDQEEFLELDNMSGRSTSLDGYIIVLFNGNNDKAYTTIDLAGNKTRSNGLFLLGAAKFSPDISLTSNWLQNGADAVALYNASASQFPVGAVPNQTGLVDVVVYSKYNKIDTGLLRALVPGQSQLKEDDQLYVPDESLTRCHNKQPKNQSAFVLAPTTPGTRNNCTKPPTIEETPTSPVQVPGKTQDTISLPSRLPAEYLVINEVNADSIGAVDTGEFIELSDGGVGNRSLDDFVLVLYQGSTAPASVYDTIDLTNQTTRSNGLFLIGGNNINADINISRRNFLKNGAAAVAIHKGGVSDYPKGKTASSANLVDVVVYTKYAGRAILVIDRLLPGQTPIRELATFHPADEAISRCYCRQRFLPAFQLELQTPGQPNNCSGYIRPKPGPIYINELNADTPGHDTQEFIELYDGGIGFSCLDDLTLVFFSAGSKGTNDVAYRVITLSGNMTNKDGYFVIAQPAVSNHTDVIITKSFIENGADAVALYNAADGTYSVGMSAKREGLRDAIVYGKDKATKASKLLSTLMPGQAQIHENPNHSTEDESISRCTRCKAPFSQAFTLSHTTPGRPNNCTGFSLKNYPQPSLLINEFNADNPFADKKEFIELYDGGHGGTCLFNLTLVLYNGGSQGNWAGASNVVNLAPYSTDRNGFLLIGSPEVNPDIALPLYNLQNGPDAIVLYRGPVEDFPLRSAPVSSGLVDAVVYSVNDVNASLLLRLLTPGQVQIKEDPKHLPVGDETVSRCLSNNTLDLSAFVITHPTPRSHNNCSKATVPSATASTSTATTAAQETTSRQPTIQTTGMRFTGRYTSSVTPSTSVISSSSSSTLTSAATTQNTATTVAVSTRRPMTSLTLVSTPTATYLDGALTSSSTAPSTATATSPSVRTTPVLVPKIYINEINADQPGLDTNEFVELYDNGLGYTRLDGLLLVFFNGNGDSSYRTIDLHGKTTDSNGFFVVGSPSLLATAPPAVSFKLDGGKQGFLQNGADAIAIYQAQPTAFPDGTPVTSNGLVDAVVYGTNDREDVGLVSVLTPGQRQINENHSTLIGDESISRCHYCRPFDQSSYIISLPTPFAENYCGALPTATNSVPSTGSTRDAPSRSTLTSTPFVANQDAIRYLVINEVNADQPGVDEAEFIELYDGGRGATSLDNVVLVLFNGNLNDRSYKVIDLSGNETSDDGFFVIGTPAVRPLPNVVVRGGSQGSPLLQNGADAIALYSGTAEMFPVNTKPKKEGLIDVVVYGTGDQDDRTLLAVLAPGQRQVNEDWAHHEEDESISRCSCCQQRNLTAFTVTHPPTPGKDNACRKREITVRLETADCANWKANDTEEVLSYLAKFVTQKCGCSFTVGKNVMSGGRAHCDGHVGQLVVSAVFLEDTDALLERDMKLYEEFLAETQNISVGKVRYQVASTCCSSRTPTASVPSMGTTESKDSNGKDC